MAACVFGEMCILQTTGDKVLSYGCVLNMDPQVVKFLQWTWGLSTDGTVKGQQWNFRWDPTMQKLTWIV